MSDGNLTNGGAAARILKVSKCTEKGCNREAAVKGLCSLHYQRKRRQEGSTHQVGRPRQYAKEIADPNRGAPRLTIRLEPEVLEWVRARGGGAWLRAVTRRLMALSEVPEFQACWERLCLNGNQEGWDCDELA